MAGLLFNEQDSFNNHTCADAAIVEYPCFCPEPGDSALDFLTDPSQGTSDIYSSWMPSQNTLGLYATYEHDDADWAVDPFAYTSATSTSNGIDTRFFNTLFSHQPSHSDSAVPLWQQPTPRYPSLRGDAALSGVGENHISRSFHAVTLPERQPAQNSTARSPGKRVGASHSLAQSAPPRSVRHTPYPISSRRCTSPVSVYQCKWSNGARSCGMLVMGAKNAIGKHLQDEHAVRLKADKTLQACLWGECGRLMLKESIARHILAVHMRDKVLCPTCGSRFARTDSLQRHQRTQCLIDGEAFDGEACDAGKTEE